MRFNARVTPGGETDNNRTPGFYQVQNTQLSQTDAAAAESVRGLFRGRNKASPFSPHCDKKHNGFILFRVHTDFYKISLDADLQSRGGRADHTLAMETAVMAGDDKALPSVEARVFFCAWSLLCEKSSLCQTVGF